MGCGPPGDVHDTVCGADVEHPLPKVDVEEAILVAEAMRRTLACSTQRLFRTRKLNVREPTRGCALMSATQLWRRKGEEGANYEHARTSTTQPSRLQKFERASRDTLCGSRPIQSTRDGSFEPLHLGTVCLSSSMIACDAAGSRDFPSSRAISVDPGDREYGRFSERSMRRLPPRTVMGMRL